MSGFTGNRESLLLNVGWMRGWALRVTFGPALGCRRSMLKPSK